MKRDEVWNKVCDSSLLAGKFILRSGKLSNKYFDKYQFEANPELLKQIVLLMKEKRVGDEEIIVGLELGGIPLATVLSQETNIPLSLVRKTPKEYGTKRQVEGANVAGKNICLIEDVVTSGGALFDAIKVLRNEGAIVEKAICVIVRDKKAIEKFKEIGVDLQAVFVTDESDFGNSV
jgi:orotate phosphoribosyltransferase